MQPIITRGFQLREVIKEDMRSRFNGSNEVALTALDAPIGLQTRHIAPVRPASGIAFQPPSEVAPHMEAQDRPTIAA